MLELAAAEPEAMQIQARNRDDGRTLKKLLADLDAFELRTFLNGPHDKCNCIFTINAGAGGTEAQDWAEMLSRMYGRWFDLRGWKWEVTDALAGRFRRLEKRHLPRGRRKRLRLIARRNAACTGSCAFRRSIPTSAGTRVFPAWTPSRN